MDEMVPSEIVPMEQDGAQLGEGYGFVIKWGLCMAKYQHRHFTSKVVNEWQS